MMPLSNIFFFGLEILGTISFAIAGGMEAIQKKTDFFGVLFLAAVTAVGGGIFRDILLGKIPPTAFVEKIYVFTAIGTACILFLWVKKNKETYARYEEQISTVNNIFDAIGLGIFTVVGFQVALQSNPEAGIFFNLFLGLMTAVGGGILRDLMLQEIPFVLKKRVYALASLVGGGCYCFLIQIIPTHVASAISVLVVFTIRMLATKYQWNLPKAIE